MRLLIPLLVGLSLGFDGQAVRADSREPLLMAAGFSAPATPHAAADFELSDPSGRRHRLHEQRGKVVFLNFWATWCPPCREEMPAMEQLYQDLRQQPFAMWAVNYQERPEVVTRFFSVHQLHFLALVDTEGSVSARYELLGLPTTYLIDCGGQMVGRAVGPRSWSNDAIRTLLAALLGDASCRQSTPGHSPAGK